MLTFLADYPLLLLGILLLSAHPLRPISRVRVGLDGVMMMTAIITLSWYFVLGPTLLQGSTSLLAKVVGTAYPCGDLILLLCVLLLWGCQENRIMRPVLLLLSLGLLILVLTGSVYDYQHLQNSFAIGGLIDPLWSLGFQCIGLAILALRRTTTLPPTASPQPSRSLWPTLLPYAFIFKEVNDTFGHQLGDHLLRQVGERLCQSVDITSAWKRPSDPFPASDVAM